MKVVQLNAVCSGSTGKICMSVSELLTQQGIENYILYADGSASFPTAQRYMSRREIKLQALRSRVLGNYGFNSRAATRRLLKQLDAISPDIVHLHNLHGHNCHLGMLLSYLKEKKIKTFITLHDCWFFTAYCPHFDMIGCEKWKHGCSNCSQHRQFSWFFDRSRALYERKKALVDGLDLTLVSPSFWTQRMAKESFLKDFPHHVVHNGINLTVFRPTAGTFREKYNCEGKYLVLGVSFLWGEKKGLDVFLDLAKRLDDRYRIVLVGTLPHTDVQLPENIISIPRTGNQQELAEIYTAADVFVNPTREEVLGLVNIEALACGTPVVTFDTGGSPECLNADCGNVVPKNDVDAMHHHLINICEHAPYSAENCIRAAQHFDEQQRFAEYVELYKKYSSEPCS